MSVERIRQDVLRAVALADAAGLTVEFDDEKIVFIVDGHSRAISPETVKVTMPMAKCIAEQLGIPLADAIRAGLADALSNSGETGKS